MKPEYFESVELSDVGRKRKNNEDACLRIPEHEVYCVADGMGGQAGGDLASEAIITALQQVYSKVGPDEDNTFSQRIALFRKGTNQASKWIKNFSDEKVIGQMGSTLVGLVIDPRNPARAVGLHAGDSRLYRYREGEFKLLTADHSAVAALAAKLGCDPEMIPAKYQNELLRCVGLTESVELEKTPVDVKSGDVFLICSDGLTKMLPDRAIAKILKGGSQDGIEKTARALIDAANEAGGKDNVTVVLVKAGDISAAPKVEDLPEDEEPLTAEALTTAADDGAANPLDTAGDGSALPDTSEAYEGNTPQTDDTPQTAPASIPHVPRAAESVPPIRVPEAPKAPAKKGVPRLGIGIAAAVVAVGALVWSFSGGGSGAPKVPAPAPVAIGPAAPKPGSTATGAQPPAQEGSSSSSVGVAPGPTAQASESPAIKIALPTAPPSASDDQAKADLAEAEAKRARDQEMAKEQEQAREAEQERLKVQDAYHQAIVRARGAYDSHDFKAAVAMAGAALEAIPGDLAAERLKDDAQRQLSVEESNAKYEATLREGQDALASKDFSLAAAKANEALTLKPGDSAATILANKCLEPMDLRAAGTAYDDGDYGEALAICGKYPGNEAFAQLERSCREENAAFRDALEHFGRGDYQFTVQLERRPYHSKAQFLVLLSKGKSEWATLGRLEASLHASNGWQAVINELADPESAAWVNKPPFRALAARAQEQKEKAQLDVTLETMLVEFEIKSPTDSSIVTPDGRQAKRLDGSLSQLDRDRFLKTLDQIEGDYRQNSWLDLNDRARSIKKLREAIADHK
jgi:protein phosphatase